MGMYLAVDANGAKTECVMGDDTRVLARLAGESVLTTQVGDAEATVRLRRLLTEVAAVAGVPLYLVTRTCVGLAGLAGEGVREWAEASLEQVLTGDLVLREYEEIALEAAFGRGSGVLVLAGTDSAVVGRCESGARFTAGGWGPMLGDEGSGHWIGVEAIRTSLRALDRGVPGCLLREIYAAWEVSSLRALIAEANRQPRPNFAVLVAGVARCATQGDALARSVLERAGEELAAQVSTVLAKMRAAACGEDAVQRIAYSGEVLAEIAPVREAMARVLRMSHPGWALDEQAVEPVQGALARARRP